MLGKTASSPLIIDHCDGPNMKGKDGENDSNVSGSYSRRLLVMEQNAKTPVLMIYLMQH